MEGATEAFRVYDLATSRDRTSQNLDEGHTRGFDSEDLKPFLLVPIVTDSGYFLE
jgi:hypothetical protein